MFTHTIILDIGASLSSGIEAVELRLNGGGNRANCSEEEKGNCGELHGERFEIAKEIKVVEKMDLSA